MGISLEQALKRCDFRGGTCAPPFCAVQAFRRRYRLIGLLEIAVNQVFVGFKGFLEARTGVLCIVKHCETSTGFDEINCEISTGFT